MRIHCWRTKSVHYGGFAVAYPLFVVPTMIWGPHTVSQVPDMHEDALWRAAESVTAALTDRSKDTVVDTDRGY